MADRAQFQILTVRQDDLSGVENHFHVHLRKRHPFFQFFKPIQDDVDLGARHLGRLSTADVSQTRKLTHMLAARPKWRH